MTDLEGIAPSLPAGERFAVRLEVWEALWPFLCSFVLDLVDRELVDAGGYNEGARVEAAVAVSLASRLDLSLRTGAVARRLECRAARPLAFTEDELRSLLTFLRGSRGFAIW